MKNISIRDMESLRLFIKKPTMDEQYNLWKIVKDENVNKYYFPTPERVFNKNKLSYDKKEDIVKARKFFMEEFNNWERQEPFYEEKIKLINKEDNSQKFTWSIFLKTGEVIGQITVQPNPKYPYNSEIRDIGWFIDPKYQGCGYASEAAIEVLKFMFLEVEIDKIITGAVVDNIASWKLMEKLGFKRMSKESSPYYDEDGNNIDGYSYVCSREMFLRKFKIVK